MYRYGLLGAVFTHGFVGWVENILLYTGFYLISVFLYKYGGYE